MSEGKIQSTKITNLTKKKPFEEKFWERVDEAN